MNTQKIRDAFLTCALWSSTQYDNDDRPYDEDYDILDFALETVSKADRLIHRFVAAAGDWLQDWDESQVGHDLWLTINGHGAGFWDRGMPTGDALSRLCAMVPEMNVVTGDDGQLYLE